MGYVPSAPPAGKSRLLCVNPGRSTRPPGRPIVASFFVEGGDEGGDGIVVLF